MERVTYFGVSRGTVKSTKLKFEGRKSEKAIDRIRAIPVPMSHKRVVTRSSSRLKAQELGGERDGEDGESQNQGQGQGLVVAFAALTTKDDIMATDDLKRLLRGYVDVADLFHAFRLVSKPWQRIAEEKIDEDFRKRPRGSKNAQN